MNRSLPSRVLLVLLMMGVGILIAAQLRVQGRLRAVQVEQDEQGLLISELVQANSGLRAEIQSLGAQLSAYEESQGGGMLKELVAELNRGRAINGAAEVSGPGVELLIDGPLSALDLQDLINELRNGGAEAIALNGRRWVVSSVPTVDGTGNVVVEGRRLDRPYQIQVIGDPDTIETALLRPGGLIAILKRTYPGLVVQSTQHSRLVLGVHRPTITFRYAQPAE